MKQTTFHLFLFMSLSVQSYGMVIKYNDSQDEKFSQAIRNNDIPTIRKMIDKGVNCDGEIMYEISGHNALLIKKKGHVLEYLFRSLIHSSDLPMIQLFIDAGADPTKTGERAGYEHHAPAARDLLLKPGKITQELLVKNEYLHNDLALLVRTFLTPRKLLYMLKKKKRKTS